VEAILAALGAHPNSPALAETGCGALTELTADKGGSLKIVKFPVLVANPKPHWTEIKPKHFLFKIPFLKRKCFIFHHLSSSENTLSGPPDCSGMAGCMIREKKTLPDGIQQRK